MSTLNAKSLETAFRKVMRNHAENKHPSSVQEARNILRSKGWTQSAASRQLGVSSIHLCYVLNGRRQSLRVLKAIGNLPPNPNPA